MLGVGLLTGIGIIGRGGEGAARAVEGGSAVAVASLEPVVALGGGATATVDRLIVIESPAFTNAVITTRDLVVEGYVLSATGPIDIVLESSGNKARAARTVQPMTGSAALFSGGRTAFSATFPISNPRPGGRMVVQIIAYDRSGIPMDSLRRRIQIGAIAP